MNEDDVLHYLLDLYKLSSVIVYDKKHKNCRKKLLKLIKKIKKDGLESVLDDED